MKLPDAYETHISQVIHNLIGNALTHTGEDRCITVTQAVHDGYAYGDP